jgi:hypothetical protein
MNKLFRLSSIPILCALIAAGCATGNPAADAFGNWVGGMMIAETGRPQVTINNAPAHQNSDARARAEAAARAEAEAYARGVLQGRAEARAKAESEFAAKKTATIFVTAADEDARIFANGTYVGNTPAKIKLIEGTHTIEVKKDGFMSFTDRINVTSGSDLTIRAVLQKQ